MTANDELEVVVDCYRVLSQLLSGVVTKTMKIFSQDVQSGV